MPTATDGTPTPPIVPPLAPEPLPPAAARRAEEEALQRAREGGDAGAEALRRGRIEAETRRISAEVTRHAQERVRAQSQDPSRSAPLQRPAGAAETEQAPTPEGVDVPHRARPEPKSIDRVVVPLDGTPYAERALPYAAAATRATGASLLLVRVQEPLPSGPVDALTTAIERMVSVEPHRATSDAALYLQAVRDRIVGDLPQAVQVEARVARAPSGAAGLLEVIGQVRADLVVMATHAREGLERRLLGSVGDLLIQDGRTPVLFIPPQLEAPSAPPAFRRVLVPLDGSRVAEQALVPLLALAQRAPASPSAGMEIVLFQVVEHILVRPDAMRYLGEIRDWLLTLPLPPTVHVTATAVIGSAPGAIVGAAERGVITEPYVPGAFDLVAMATHGRGGLRRWLYGSVAAYILPRITVPVLLVHPERTDR